MIGRGENYDHMVYVEDLVEGLRRCSEIQGIDGRTYILTGAQPAKLREVLEVIAEELGANAFFDNLVVTPFCVYQRLCSSVYRSFGIQLPRSHYYDLFFRSHIFNTTKAREELSYFPKVSLQDGFQRLLEWYREEGYLPLALIVKEQAAHEQ